MNNLALIVLIKLAQMIFTFILFNAVETVLGVHWIVSVQFAFHLAVISTDIHIHNTALDQLFLQMVTLA